MVVLLLLACGSAKEETSVAPTEPGTTETEPPTETGTACTTDDASLTVCVYLSPSSEIGASDGHVYAVPPGETVAIESNVDDSGCVTYPAWAGTWTVWAESSGGSCTSDAEEIALEPCGAAALDVYTEAGCVDG